MKFLIDINHPAHVHYSKNIIKELIRRGHQVIVTARNRNPVFDLLDHENISYISRGKGSNSMLGKAMYFLRGDYEILKVAKNVKPDLLLCFMSPYAPQVSKIIGKPCIIMDDTEHAKLHDRFTYPFCDTIITPSCFNRDLGKKQIRINSYFELNYLHPQVFSPDPNIFDLLGLKSNEPYVLIRLVAWGGHHDKGHSGLTEETQKLIVEKLEGNYKIFISSEMELPDYFEQYRIIVPPEKMHDVLSFASLFVGESGTMASECAVLGTPSIYVNSLSLMGYLQEAQKNGILYHFEGDQGVLDKVEELSKIPNLRDSYADNHLKHIRGKINGTSFMVWFLENYPKSIAIAKNDPNYEPKSI